MIIQELLAAKKITQEDVTLYCLFVANDLGSQWLKSKIESTFMEAPPLPETTGIALALVDGRRNFLREIKHSIDMINNLIREYVNDTGQPEQQQ